MPSEALCNKQLCQILCVIQTFCVHQLPYMRFFVVTPIKVYIRGILGDPSMTALCAQLTKECGTDKKWIQEIWHMSKLCATSRFLH